MMQSVAHCLGGPTASHGGCTAPLQLLFLFMDVDSINCKGGQRGRMNGAAYVNVEAVASPLWLCRTTPLYFGPYFSLHSSASFKNQSKTHLC